MQVFFGPSYNLKANKALQTVILMPRTRKPLFSVEPAIDGTIELYLENQGAVADMLEDVVGWYDLETLDTLKTIAAESVKAEDHFERLEAIKDEIESGAPCIASMNEKEALNLAKDIINAVRIQRFERSRLVG